MDAMMDAMSPKLHPELLQLSFAGAGPVGTDKDIVKFKRFGFSRRADENHRTRIQCSTSEKICHYLEKCKEKSMGAARWIS